MALSKETGFTQVHIIAPLLLPRKQVLHRPMSLHCSPYQGNRFYTDPCHCTAALTKETGFPHTHVIAGQLLPRKQVLHRSMSLHCRQR